MFNDLTIWGVIHFEDNALPFVDALLRLGAHPRRITLFAKNAAGYRYQNRNAVIRTLGSWGDTVLGTENITAGWFESIADAAVERNERQFFGAVRAHNKFRKGVVELSSPNREAHLKQLAAASEKAAMLLRVPPSPV